MKDNAELKQTKLRRTCTLTDNGPTKGGPEGQFPFTPLLF